jgi:phosphoglycerate dehydrogenase-like enzyme
MWCYDGWHTVADRLELMLPPWVKLLRMDPHRPLADQVKECQVLIPTTGSVGEDVIRAAPLCKLIAQPASGHENICMATAKELGIPVTIAPGSNSQSVAEAALMMMLMLARQVLFRTGSSPSLLPPRTPFSQPHPRNPAITAKPPSRRATEALRVFQEMRIGEPEGMELSGKTLGIIGMGGIGRALERAARGLGMEVQGLASQSSREDLERLLRESHVVSIHCPLNERTNGLLGRAELAMMRPGERSFLTHLSYTLPHSLNLCGHARFLHTCRRPSDQLRPWRGH